MKFDFDTPITADLDLYAKWTEDTNLPTSYTVSFNMNGHGTQVVAQTIEEGGKVAKPADPVESGWIFKGWYADANFQTLFDFEAAIFADITIYAKWVTDSATPTDPISPNTGNNSHLLLWVMLLATSSAAFIGTAFYNRKKRKTKQPMDA